MRTLSQDGTELQDPDLSLGHLEPGRVFVKHHDAVEYQPATYKDVEVQRYENGGVLYHHVLETPSVPASEAYDEYESVMIYVPYTEDELKEIEEKKQELEQEQQEAQQKYEEEQQRLAEVKELVSTAPKRLETLEQSQLDTDEALVGLYESILTLQSETK